MIVNVSVSKTTTDAGFHINYSRLRFETFYPGGLFGTCSFRAAPGYVQVISGSANSIVKLRTSQIVWEGVVEDITPQPDGSADIRAIGRWGQLLGRKISIRPYADTRMTAQAWPYQETANAAEKAFVDYDNRIRITPKSEAWGTNEPARVRYTTFGNEKIKWIKFDYDLTTSAAAPDWTLRVLDVDNSADILRVSRTTAGNSTGSVNAAIATASDTIDILFESEAAQTPASDGSVYGEVSNLQLFADRQTSPTSATMNIDELLDDVANQYSAEISTSTAFQASNTYSLIPFLGNGRRVTDVMLAAASRGDGSSNAWAVGLLASDKAGDNKPAIYSEQVPALTDYEYQIRADQLNGGAVARGYSRIFNSLLVRYVDDRGIQQIASHTTDTNLENSDSQTAYNFREAIFNLGNVSLAQVQEFAQAYLSQSAEPVYYMTAPIRVTGQITTKAGAAQAVAEVRAGQRIRITNYNGALEPSGVTMLISRTVYESDTDTVSIYASVPDDLAVLIARLSGAGAAAI